MMTMRLASDLRRLTVVVTALAALGGCDRKTVERTPDALEHARLEKTDPSHGASIGPILSEVSDQEGVAEVVAVDPGQGTIALRHRPTTVGDWPVMVMTFRARRSLVAIARAGQTVRFRLVLRDGVGEIVDLIPTQRGGPASAATP